MTLVLALTGIYAQAQWTAVKPAYGGAIGNDGAVSFVIGNKGYLVAGSSTSNVYEYDISGNSWANIGSIPDGAGHAFAMAFVLGSKAYVVGGDSSGYPMASVWQFDPASSTKWARKKDFPGGVRDAGIAFAVNNTGYVGAGFDGTGMHNDIYKYDEVNDNWMQLPEPMPEYLIFSNSFVVGNTAYVIGGGVPPAGTSETANMWEFVQATGKWKASVSFPGTARQAAFAFSNNLYGYYGGGMTAYTNVYSDVWRFEPASRQWKKIEDVPLLGPAWSSSFVSGNTAYVGLGAKFAGSGLTGDDKFYKYSMQTTNVQETGNTMKVSVYPNPASDYIHINGKTINGVADVYNSTGVKVMSVQVNNNSIDVRTLPGGLYIMRIVGEQPVMSTFQKM